MNRQLFKNVTLTALCLILSGLFLYYGAGTLLSGKARSPVVLFSAVVLGYGLINFILLMIAWLHPQASLLTVARIASVIMIAAFALGSFDSGIISGHEWVAIVLIGAMVWLNWLALRRLTMSRLRA